MFCCDKISSSENLNSYLYRANAIVSNELLSRVLITIKKYEEGDTYGKEYKNPYWTVKRSNFRKAKESYPQSSHPSKPICFPENKKYYPRASDTAKLTGPFILRPELNLYFFDSDKEMENNMLHTYDFPCSVVFGFDWSPHLTKKEKEEKENFEKIKDNLRKSTSKKEIIFADFHEGLDCFKKKGLDFKDADWRGVPIKSTAT